jgi:hypothetical protein
VIRLTLLLCYLTAAFSGSRPCCCASTPPAERPTAPTKKHACPLCAAEKTPAPKPPTPAKKHHCPCPKAELKAPALPPPSDDTRQFTPAAGVLVDELPLLASSLAVRVIHPGPPPDPSLHLLLLCHRLRC